MPGTNTQSEIGTGRYDASYGQLLLNNGKAVFSSPPAIQTGFYLDGDVKNLKLIKTAKGDEMVIASVNDNWLKWIKVNKR